jgi:hypothetical protein
MKNIHHLVSDDLANDILNDDIDQLYCQLEQLEPPTFLVDSIMASVAQLQNKVQEKPVSEELVSSLNDLGGLLLGGLRIQLS